MGPSLCAFQNFPGWASLFPVAVRNDSLSSTFPARSTPPASEDRGRMSKRTALAQNLQYIDARRWSCRLLSARSTMVCPRGAIKSLFETGSALSH